LLGPQQASVGIWDWVDTDATDTAEAEREVRLMPRTRKPANGVTQIPVDARKLITVRSLTGQDWPATFEGMIVRLDPVGGPTPEDVETARKRILHEGAVAVKVAPYSRDAAIEVTATASATEDRCQSPRAVVESLMFPPKDLKAPTEVVTLAREVMNAVGLK
jgi:hypothetical protein